MSDAADEDGRIHRGTSSRIDSLSSEERTALAREFAAKPRKRAVAPPPPIKAVRPAPAGFPTGVVRGPEEEEVAAEVARVSADLHRTQRQLDRIERTYTRSRFVMAGASAPHGRYARLLSRADRLERRLRSLG